MTELQYVPEFESVKVREGIIKRNAEIEIELSEIIESNALKYNLVSLTTDEIGRALQGAITSAGNRIFNKATSVMMAIAQEHFGGEFNVEHARKYYEDKEKKEDK